MSLARQSRSSSEANATHDSFGTVRDQRRRAVWCGLPSITSYITKQWPSASG